MGVIESMLLDTKAEQEERKKAFGRTCNHGYDDYIFVREDGERYKVDWVTRTFKEFLKKNNLRVIRFHDLRHTCATMLRHTELKENPKSATIVNEIVAFLNTCEGKIYIGVKDDGTIAGVDDIDKASVFASNIIADQIEPNPRGLVSIETPTVDGKRIIEIVIKKGDKLYYVKKYGMSSAGCFERIGASSRGMTPEQIAKRFAETIAIPEKKNGGRFVQSH